MTARPLAACCRLLPTTSLFISCTQSSFQLV